LKVVRLKVVRLKVVRLKVVRLKVVRLKVVRLHRLFVLRPERFRGRIVRYLALAKRPLVRQLSQKP
jgi:hypothetical protein